MTTPAATWASRDLPVLRAVEQLDLLGGPTHELSEVVARTGLRGDEVVAALETLQALRAVRVEVLDGRRTRVGNVTAIGAAMLAMQAENDLAC
ncbi:hypothetical protein ACF3NS_12830 [Arsenicicoccus cauae]|uniref:DprA winged helix domain-containing protein n=1 Tax=Arsenicicoccus cauae TaxID=2663847 RepID=A0A6I3I2Z7_9MICO|nr:hypothetical protein [Arsenicicoccus cauae]MTB70524.1 hypothetical protein [Arsenicicoccus cauae]